MTQWHPLFAQLLRPLLEKEYDIQTNVPVGDLPREADVVLLRRLSGKHTRHSGLWRWLTAWNVLEFKGPSASARVDDLDALLELGLGIQRRLRTDKVTKRVPRHEMSYWYLANDLGRRFLAAAKDLAGDLEPMATGVWRATVWQRPLLLVSNQDVAIERDSLPLHVLTAEPGQDIQTLLGILAAERELWEPYGGTLSWLHPELVKEMELMARTKSKGLHPSFGPLVKWMGKKEAARQLVEEVGIESLIEEVGVKPFVKKVGVKSLVDEVGAQPIIEELGLDSLLDALTPSQRAELLRRLQDRSSNASQRKRTE